jgi:hypothetical protein
MRQLQRRRDSGMTARRNSAAMPDRKLAICQPLREATLMAAPPVEKSAAAAIIRRR